MSVEAARCAIYEVSVVQPAYERGVEARGKNKGYKGSCNHQVVHSEVPFAGAVADRILRSSWEENYKAAQRAQLEQYIDGACNISPAGCSGKEGKAKESQITLKLTYAD